LFVPEGVVPLRVWHCARVEPCVDDLRRATHRPLARAARPDVLIDPRLVRIEVLGQLAHTLGQLRERADHLSMLRIRVADPDWERCAPITIARERPIDVAFQPLAETTGTDLRRVPRRLPV